jgi:hypothetical protein
MLRRQLPRKRSHTLQSTVHVLSPKSKRIRKAQESVAQDAAFEELISMRTANGGRNLYGDFQSIVTKYKERGFNVQRHHIEYRLKLRKQGKVMNVGKNCLPVININDGTVVSDLTDPIDIEDNNICEIVEKRKGGRTKGSTNEFKKLNTKKMDDALTEASTLCLNSRRAAKLDGKKLVVGTFRTLINETELKFGLNEGTINYDTVKSRVFANNPTGISHQSVSPLKEVEDIIVDCCVRLSKMGEALTKEEVMCLADDILADSIHVDRLVEFCAKRKITKDVSDGKIVGNRWYANFIKRHQDKIKCKPCRVQDRKRLTWCTHNNFLNMYNSVYEAMVEAGVAEKFDEEVWLDCHNQVTINQHEAIGRKTRYRLLKPERCVFVDETGCNTNMKTDGHVGGRRYVMANGQSEGARTGVTSDIHFTLLAFTSGTGEAIMCAIIMKSEKHVADLPISWKLGIDITKEINTGQTLLETYDSNKQSGASIGGPRCTYLGITVPCFVCTSPNASITSELLAEMLATIDKAGIFQRSEEEGIPFLLLDGHHSRTRLPFLNYVNDPAHLWKVCIGVPYATHMWQPHDSSELNGSFKTCLYKAKDMYLRHKPESMQRFVSTDIIPLVNACWNQTLGNKGFAMKSLMERGWSILNYCLLDDPRLLDKPTTTTTTIDDDNQQESASCTITSINPVSERYYSTLDKLLDDRLKSDGRKRKYTELLTKTATKSQKIQHLEKMLSVSSGKLACNNIFCLDENVRDKLLEDDKMKRQKKSELDIRKQQQQQKQSNTFKHAAIKYFQNKNLLLGEIKALLKYTANKDDSPIKTKIVDLRNQLHRRKQRLDFFNINSVVERSSESIDNDGNNVDFLFENENTNGENIQNIFLPNSGDTPEFGSIDFMSTVENNDVRDSSIIPEFGSKEHTCQRTLNI